MHKSTKHNHWIANTRPLMGHPATKRDHKGQESISLNYGPWISTKTDWTHVLDGHFRNNNQYTAQHSFKCFIGLLESLSQGRVHWAYSLEENVVLHAHVLLHVTKSSLTVEQIKKAWARYGKRESHCRKYFHDLGNDNTYRLKRAHLDLLPWDIDKRLKHQLQGDST